MPSAAGRASGRRPASAAAARASARPDVEVVLVRLRSRALRRRADGSGASSSSGTSPKRSANACEPSTGGSEARGRHGAQRRAGRRGARGSGGRPRRTAASRRRRRGRRAGPTRAWRRRERPRSRARSPTSAPSTTRIETPIGPTRPFRPMRAYAPTSPPCRSATAVSVVESASTRVARHTTAPGAQRAQPRQRAAQEDARAASDQERRDDRSRAADDEVQGGVDLVAHHPAVPAQVLDEPQERAQRQQAAPDQVGALLARRTTRRPFPPGGEWRVGVLGRRVFVREPAARPRARVVALVIGEGCSARGRAFPARRERACRRRVTDMFHPHARVVRNP